MASLAERLETLIGLAQESIDSGPSDLDHFVAVLEQYLDSLESWRADAEAAVESLTPELRGRIEHLDALHRKLMQNATASQKLLINEMGEVKKKAGAMRAYVDRLPQRITITGKRKG